MGGLQAEASNQRSEAMRALVTIEYEMDRPPGVDRDLLRQREAARWIASETLHGLRTATVKVELIDEPGWWEPIS